MASCQNTDEVEIALNNVELWNIGGRRGIGRILRVLRLDTQGPDASEVSLNLQDGWFNPLPTTATLNFPSDIDMDEVTIDDFMAVGTGACSGNLVSSLTKSNTQVTLGLNTLTCLNGNKVTFSLDLRNVKDKAGNMGSGVLEASMTLLTANPSAPSFDFDSGIYSILPTNLTANFGISTNMASVADAISAIGSGACQINPLISSSNTLFQTSILLNSVGCQSGDRLTLRIDMSKVKTLLGVAGNGIIEKVFTLDSTGPISPILDFESGSYNPLPLTLNLHFEADTDMSSVNSNSVTVVGSGACNAQSIINMLKADKTVTLNLDTASCGDGNSITLSIDMSLIKDTHGNFGSGILTKTFTLSNSIPTAPSISVAPGISQNLPTSLTLTFDSLIDMATVSLADFTIQGTGSCSGAAIASGSAVGQTFVMTFNNSACGDASSMILSLDMSNVATTAPTWGAGAIRYTYLLDKTGPSSALISPSAGTLALLPQDIFITLPDDTNISTVSIADFEVSAVNGCPSLNISNLAIAGLIVKVSVDSSSCSSGDAFIVKANMSGIQERQ